MTQLYCIRREKLGVKPCRNCEMTGEVWESWNDDLYGGLLRAARRWRLLELKLSRFIVILDAVISQVATMLSIVAAVGRDDGGGVDEAGDVDVVVTRRTGCRHAR